MIFTSWDNMCNDIQSIIETSKEKFTNEIDDMHKFHKLKKYNRYELKCSKLKKEYKYERKLCPEFKNKGEKDMLIPLEVWDKLWPIIKNMFWKVQNGLVFWYATQVWNHDWEDKVLRLLKLSNIQDAHSKPVCTQVFGIFSKFFRKLRDCSSLIGYKGI